MIVIYISASSIWKVYSIYISNFMENIPLG